METITLSPQDNIEKIINGLTQPAIVELQKGIYNIKAEITANDVTIIGEDRDNTVITYGDYARKIHADGKEYNTFRTYTLCVTGDNVRLENLTVINSNTDPGVVGQCVALSVHGKFFSAKNLSLKSTQDTLFLAPFPDDLVVRYDGFIPERQLYMEGEAFAIFEECQIYGTVDFIFGCAEAHFKDCEIISIYDRRDTGFVAAPAHSLKQENGFIFLNCKFTSLGVPPKTVCLARPWRDFGKCAFINCTLGKHFKRELFDKWNDTSRDRTARFLYYGLTCDFTPEPVPWAKALTKPQAERIVNYCNDKFRNMLNK